MTKQHNILKDFYELIMFGELPKPKDNASFYKVARFSD